jgi:hypothetical protein
MNIKNFCSSLTILFSLVFFPNLGFSKGVLGEKDYTQTEKSKSPKIFIHKVKIINKDQNYRKYGQVFDDKDDRKKVVANVEARRLLYRALDYLGTAVVQTDKKKLDRFLRDTVAVLQEYTKIFYYSYKDVENILNDEIREFRNNPNYDFNIEAIKETKKTIRDRMPLRDFSAEYVEHVLAGKCKWYRKYRNLDIGEHTKVQAACGSGAKKLTYANDILLAISGNPACNASQSKDKKSYEVSCVKGNTPYTLHYVDILCCDKEIY